jgi:hypothetical protein
VDLANLEQRARASETELIEIRGELAQAREALAGSERRAEGDRTEAASRVAALVQRAEKAESLAAEEARERKSVIEERDAALAQRATQAANLKRVEGELTAALRRAAENAPDETLAKELADAQSQLTESREVRSALEDKIRELERRPTQEDHRSVAQEKVRLEGALRTATDERTRLEGQVRTLQEAQRGSESTLATERRLRGELETWVRGLFAARSFRLPTGIGPPPGVDVGPIACQLTIVAGSEAVIREIVAETPQGSRKVEGGQFSLSRGESRTVTLPAGTTLVRVRYDGDYNPNSRSYRIRGDVKRVEIQGSVERLDL